MRKLLLMVLASGCSTPPVAQEEAPVQQVASAPMEVAVSSSEPAPEPAKAKKKPLTYERCQKLNAPFIQCGWKCLRGRRGPDGVNQCVNACSPMLNQSVGKKCLYTHGPGFG